MANNQPPPLPGNPEPRENKKMPFGIQILSGFFSFLFMTVGGIWMVLLLSVSHMAPTLLMLLPFSIFALGLFLLPGFGFRGRTFWVGFLLGLAFILGLIFLIGLASNICRVY
jgi:hypothetical protein